MELTRQAARFASGLGARRRCRRRASSRPRRSPTRVQPFARPLIDEHRAAGRPLVLATTTPYDLVKPLADALGFDDVVATRYGERDGVYDGTLDGEFVWGPGKLRADRGVGDGARRRPRRELGLLRQLLRRAAAVRGRAPGRR